MKVNKETHCSIHRKRKSEFYNPKEIQVDDKIRIGISSCLLGEKVRYDGEHKHDRYITDTLGQWFEYVPVCPEVDCGLPVPRESMRLEGTLENPRLIGNKTRTDYTDQMNSWAKLKLAELEKENLCGFIFKSKSPSSGMERIKIYDENGVPSNQAVGIWAAAFREKFPLLPVEDDGRLHDPKIRETFIESVFVFYRWRKLVSERKTLGKLVEFHTRHKLLIMSHSVELYRKMGKTVAEGSKEDISRLFDNYQELLAKAMKLKTTVKKNANVLYHLIGYFKKLLTGDEKQELLEQTADYAGGYSPLIVPLTLFNHYVRKYGQPYLEKQYYLNPHPVEMKLRTHVSVR
jgi:uncharacterized protein YbgA (DUF1722 family)/uncharacterized protein YbbK (DUF523 family)